MNFVVKGSFCDLQLLLIHSAVTLDTIAVDNPLKKLVGFSPTWAFLLTNVASNHNRPVQHINPMQL